VIAGGNKTNLAMGVGGIVCVLLGIFCVLLGIFCVSLD
jgi:hypothetical protein